MEVIGARVKHVKYGEGIIVAVLGEFIEVDFSGDIKRFAIESLNKFFTFEDVKVGAYFDEMIGRMLEEKRIKKEAERAAREEKIAIAEAAERARVEQRERQRNNNRIEHNEPSLERLTDERMCFIVFQNSTFDIESRGNYLWAPTSDARGVWCHYWKRLTQVRAGDIIFHCCGGEIRAVSVARGSCYSQIAPSAPIYRTSWGKMGMQVDSLYSLIPNAIKTSTYRAQITATYPAGSHYAPFDRNGDGIQGYLFELDEDLANVFLNDIMKKNPGWHL